MKLGIVGTSAIAAKFADGAVRAGWEVTSVCSRKLATGVLFAEQNRIPKVYDNLSDMAYSSEVEVIYIASPNGAHFEQAELCLKAGRHVIVEKPSFSTLREAQHILELARTRNLFVFEAMRTIHNPNFALLAQAIGHIGPVRFANLHLMGYSSKYDQFKKGNVASTFSPELSGGATYDMGVYPIYTALALFGRPQRVELAALKLHNGIDGLGVTQFFYEDKLLMLTGSKICGNAAPSTIEGEHGSLLIRNLADMDQIILRDKTGERILCDEQVPNDLVFEAAEFHRILTQRDAQAYAWCCELMLLSAEQLETARKSAGIYFAADH